jgi:hypothetical protein
VTFRTRPPLDWPELLSQVDARQRQQVNPCSHAGLPKVAWRELVSSCVLLRAAAVCAVIVLLVLARQWYQGGRIPWIHEPEHFRVDTAPEETSSRSD